MDDPWLERWLPQIRQHAAGALIFEIGCGSGTDTATLLAAGLEVLAIDLSPTAIECARQQLPAARFAVRDVRDDFPAEVQGTGVVIASLCLHYFEWKQTVSLFHRIGQTLKPGGLFVCRLNSTEDIHFGAKGHPEIEPHYYRVDGAPKRFFDPASIAALLTPPWQLLSQQHLSIGRYEKPKAVWELVCIRSAGDTGAR